MTVWLSPDGHVDGDWTNEANAYNGDTGDYADLVVGGGETSPWLTLTRSVEVEADRVRVYTTRQRNRLEDIEIEVREDGAWVAVFNDLLVVGSYQEYTFGQNRTIDGVRVRYRNDHPARSSWARVHDVGMYGEEIEAATEVVASGSVEVGGSADAEATEPPLVEVVASGSVEVNGSGGGAVQVRATASGSAEVGGDAASRIVIATTASGSSIVNGGAYAEAFGFVGVIASGSIEVGGNTVARVVIPAAASGSVEVGGNAVVRVTLDAIASGSVTIDGGAYVAGEGFVFVTASGSAAVGGVGEARVFVPITVTGSVVVDGGATVRTETTVDVIASGSVIGDGSAKVAVTHNASASGSLIGDGLAVTRVIVPLRSGATVDLGGDANVELIHLVTIDGSAGLGGSAAVSVFTRGHASIVFAVRESSRLLVPVESTTIIGPDERRQRPRFVYWKRPII